MRIFAIFAAGSVCLVAGCAGTGASYVPIVDGPKTLSFQADLADCQALSEEKPLLDGEAKTHAALGAILLGASSGLDDDADGDRLGTALGGALIGGLLGAAGGSAESHFSRKDIVKDCMEGRNHKVVG